MERSHHWSHIPELSGCPFEVGTVPGTEEFLAEIGDGYSPNFGGTLHQIFVEMECGPKFCDWARSGDSSVHMFRELQVQGESHLGCVRLDFEFIRPAFRIKPKYTAWKIEPKATHAPGRTLGNVMTHWKYKVKTRSAAKSLASESTGSGLRRMMDGRYKARHDEFFALRDRFLISHRFMELLWSSTHLVDPTDAAVALAYNSPVPRGYGGRFGSVAELVHTLPEHGQFFGRVVSAIGQSGFR